MTKEFEKRVIREGMVDTKKYRYVYESGTQGVYIRRIEKNIWTPQSLLTAAGKS